MSVFKMHRLGQIMEPEPGNPMEVGGVLNPAAIRGTDGELYLFPRLVAKDNYSRIGIARVLFNDDGNPAGVDRLGIALEPEAEYEMRENGKGGCEDPRISYVDSLRRYVMTYTAFSPTGPRIAFAVSEDLFNGKRIGLAKFEKYNGVDFVGVDNKDACIFPSFIPNHKGNLQLGILHRPLFPGTRPEDTVREGEIRFVDFDHESIWISYCPVSLKDELDFGIFNSHHRLATPVENWERLKIGGGTPPVLTKYGWMIIYHGVSNMNKYNQVDHQLCYSAGVMVLNEEHPEKILYRSVKPVLTPELQNERIGIIADVVFPTGIDRRDDIGEPERYDVYYGMADDRIGVARLNIPDFLPEEGTAHNPEAKV